MFNVLLGCTGVCGSAEHTDRTQFNSEREFPEPQTTDTGTIMNCIPCKAKGHCHRRLNFGSVLAQDLEQMGLEQDKESDKQALLQQVEGHRKQMIR